MVAGLVSNFQLSEDIARAEALVLLVPEALGTGDLGVSVALPVLLAVEARVVGHRVFVVAAGGVAGAGFELAAGG